MIYIESDPTSYLEHVRDQTIDGIRFIAAIFNWEHSSGKEAHCLVRVYIRPEKTCTVLLSAMRYPGGEKYQPFHETLPLANKLYKIINKEYGVTGDKLNWIGHFGNFSQFEHELVPDGFYHEYFIFQNNEWVEGPTNISSHISSVLIHEEIPLQLEPGAALIEGLGWGNYPMGWS